MPLLNRRERMVGISLLTTIFFAATTFSGKVSAATPMAVCQPNILVVSNTTAAFNGASSPAELCANHPVGGISLNEALFATNGASGTQPVSITFAASLAGQVISAQGLPAVRRSNVTISGLVGGDGQPTITLDGGAGDRSDILDIRASHVVVRGLRFINIGSLAAGLDIHAGRGPDQRSDHRPNQINNIWIDHDVFVGQGDPSFNDNGVVMGTDDQAFNVSLADITVSRCQFSHFRGDSDAVKLAANGSNTVIRGVVVNGNSFSDSTFPIELTTQDAANQILDTQIIGNSFQGNSLAITLGIGGIPPVTKPRDSQVQTTNDTIGNTLIAGNYCSGDSICVAISSYLSATNNTIAGTQIVNNVMVGEHEAISVNGGSSGATNNKVDGVQVVNNTIVNSGMSGLTWFNSPDGDPGNTASGLTVSNTIFWNSPFRGEVTGSEVQSSIVTGSGFAGSNGNLALNPQFLNATNDFHLQPGSPAINVGTNAGAPTTDFDGSSRADGHVDIGAFEFGAAPRPQLIVLPSEIGGTGSVTSAPSGIECPPSCAGHFDGNGSVVLKAKSDDASSFAGWSGACSGTSACTVSMNAEKSVTAMFVAATSGAGPVSVPPPSSASWLANHFLWLLIGAGVILLVGGGVGIFLCRRRMPKGA